MNAPCFRSPLRIEKIPRHAGSGDRSWLLVDDLVFESVRYPGIFIAPRGMQTDLASIPRIFSAVIPMIGAHDLAAVIHDGAYMNALVTSTGARIFTTKEVADTLFGECLRAVGVGRVARWIMVRGVRLFGNPHGHPLAANRALENL